MSGFSLGGMEPPPKKARERRPRRKRRERSPRIPRLRGLATIKSRELRELLKCGEGEEVLVADLPNKPGYCAVFISGGMTYFPVSNDDVQLSEVDKDAEYEAFKAARRKAATAGSGDDDSWEDGDGPDEHELLEDEELLEYALETELGDEDDEEDGDELVDDEEDLYGADDGLVAELLAAGESEDAVEDPLENDEDFDEEGNLLSDEEIKARKHSKVRAKVLEHGEGPKTKPLFASKRDKSGFSRVEVDPHRTRPYDVKDQLKALKFRWDSSARAWWKRIPDSQIDGLAEQVKDLGCKLRVVV